MTADQFARLKAELEASFQGTRNAGRPLLLEGGLDWKAMSLSPRDLDFMEAKHAAAREIALAIGVPPMLLGIPGDNTYSNYAEAQPRVLAPDGAAAGRPCRPRTDVVAGARLWRRAAAGARPRRGGGVVAGARSVVGEARCGELPHRRRETRRGGLWAE